MRSGTNLKLFLNDATVTSSIDLCGNFDIDLGIVDFQGKIATIRPSCIIRKNLSRIAITNKQIFSKKKQHCNYASWF